MKKFNIGDAVKGKNSSNVIVGKIVNISVSGGTTYYGVDDKIHITSFKESELVKYGRTPMTPTDDEMKMIKGALPFLKKGSVEVIYSTLTMCVFKAKHSKEIIYGQVIGDTFKKIDEKRYNYYITYNI